MPRVNEPIFHHARTPHGSKRQPEAQRTPTTLRLIAKTAATAKDSAGTRGPDGDKQGLLLLTTQAGLEMIKVGGAVVGFWFLRGTEQLAHNSQILKKLAVARDWQEALEIQNSFSATASPG